MFPRIVIGRCSSHGLFVLVVSLATLPVLVNPRGLYAAERYAFLVGVRQYDKTQLNDLQFSENDVQGLSTTLLEAGYSKRNIVLMTQSVGATSARLAPFAKNIQKELALVLREVKAGDSVLVAFSGHGVQLAGDAESYFCPADANLHDRTTLIPLGNVYKSLQASKATVKILLVDACRNDPISTLGKSRRVVDLETLSRQAPPTPPGGIAAFFSCSKGEQSFEHPDLKHGIFFHFVIQGLSGKADFDKDQQISLAELELYAVKEVQSYSRTELGTAQTPERRGEARGLLTLASLVRPTVPPFVPVPRPGQPFENSIDPAAATVTLKQADSIIFFGDSLTALAGKEEPKEHVTKGYVRIVQDKLQETHSGLGVQVDWVATGGHTVPDLLKRVDKDVIAKKPTIVVIQIGCNDARRIPRETFQTSLEQLIDKLQQSGIQVIQCSLTSVGEKHDGTNQHDAKLEEFAEVQREIAKAKKVPLNDLRKAFVAHWKASNPDNKPSGILTYDGNHFTQAGHQFVAEQMLKTFK